MAFWRFAMMDSCNPFCLRFWHWGNLFGESRYERVQILKEAKLSELISQVEFSHPELEGSQVLCPITREPIEEPVITIEGVVYEKYALIDRMKTFYDVPGSTVSLRRDDIYDFDELIGVLEFAEQRIKYYESCVHALGIKINQALLQLKQSVSYPAIFMCPLSKRKIKQAVITSEGRIYDEEAIKGYLESTGHDFDPIDGSPLNINSIIPFHELNEAICFYKNFLAESADRVSNFIDKTVDFGLDVLDFAQTFFGPPTYIEEEGELIQKPGMDFKVF